MARPANTQSLVSTSLSNSKTNVEIVSQAPVMEERSSYGFFQTTTSQTLAPTTVEEVIAILKMAHRDGRKVTLCGSNMSLDTQSLGTDISMTLAAFDYIDVDRERKTVTAGVGAKWGDVVDTVRAHNLFPQVVISTRKVSVGGSISANSLSRWACVRGREGTHVESFLMVVADGRVLRCSREQHADLFYSVIGGFGTLGVVLEVTHRLQTISLDTCVESVATKEPRLGNLSEDLLPTDPEEARYMILSLSKKGLRKMSFRSRQGEHKKVKPIWLYKHVDWTRLVAETLAHIWMWLAHAVWTFSYFFHPRENKTYVSELVPYTFFTDGNVAARGMMKRMKMKFRMIEQTYIIPVASGKAEAFIERLVEMCKARGVKPMLFDVMYLPEDEPFLLSSTRGLAGFAVNIAFEGLEGQKLEETKEMFRILTTLCKEWGGRVHLVKNVFADPADLHEMYGESLATWQELKQVYDPQNTLGSGYLERIFDLNKKEDTLQA
ncbi:MAG: FAD-binding oxidoreductase [Deltaproteobacteria bacterium]|nr:MAG: FAD-binding oxidoreductase [Deltaproteobacteria bacterium]